MPRPREYQYSFTQTSWCRRCGMPFLAKFYRHVFCSDTCRKRWSAKHSYWRKKDARLQVEQALPSRAKGNTSRPEGFVRRGATAVQAGLHDRRRPEDVGSTEGIRQKESVEDPKE